MRRSLRSCPGRASPLCIWRPRACCSPRTRRRTVWRRTCSQQSHTARGGWLTRSGPRPAKRGEVRDPVMLAALAQTGAVVGLPAVEIGELARLAIEDERLFDKWGQAYWGAVEALCCADRLDEVAKAAEAGIAQAQRRGLA